MNVEVNSNIKDILTGIEVNMQFLEYSHYEGQQNCIFTDLYMSGIFSNITEVGLRFEFKPPGVYL